MFGTEAARCRFPAADARVGSDVHARAPEMPEISLLGFWVLGFGVPKLDDGTSSANEGKNFKKSLIAGFALFVCSGTRLLLTLVAKYPDSSSMLLQGSRAPQGLQGLSRSRGLGQHSSIFKRGSGMIV